MKHQSAGKSPTEVVGQIVDDRTVVGRAIAVIEAVCECGPNVTLAELTTVTGIPKPTTLRIANNLVNRRILKRTVHGYELGPELSRLGETASLQRGFDPYLPVLEELHAAHGGIAWFTAGRAFARLELIGTVCDSRLAAPVRAEWLALGGAAKLINTAMGHLLLAQRPDLLERIAHTGMAPITPHSLREPRQLFASVHRAEQERVAVDSEQSIEGWSCVAALLPSTTQTHAVIGVALPAIRANSAQMIRSLLRAFDSMIADTDPLNYKSHSD
jgi:DNA-binding IclR family transcriptional regulator